MTSSTANPNPNYMGGNIWAKSISDLCLLNSHKASKDINKLGAMNL